MKPVWTALLTGVLISVTTCESVWAQATAQISVGVPAGSNRVAKRCTEAIRREPAANASPIGRSHQ